MKQPPIEQAGEGERRSPELNIPPEAETLAAQVAPPGAPESPGDGALPSAL
jgi:hypothetical protein